MEWVLLGLLVLALPVMAIVAFFKTLGNSSQLRAIDARLREIESRLGIESKSPFVVQPRAPRAAAASATAPVQTGPSAFGTPPSAPVSAPVAAAAAAASVAPSAAATASPPPSEAAPQPASAARPPRPPRPPVPPKPGSDASFEERFGTRWVVWVGGLALALGGIFLVRYTIEAGLIGPGLRVTMGALLALALLAAGEWTRRSENKSDVAGVPTAHIPSILTAAGTTVAYATVYASYALYGFLVPGNAFILLGIVALATLAAALLHGPILAGLGMVGAYVTPLLVASDKPEYWALFLYLAVVTAASFALARARLWRWLAIISVVFGVVWMVLAIDDRAANALYPHIFHAVAGFALAAALIVSGFLYGPPAEPGKVDAISSASIAAYVGALAILVLARNHEAPAMIALAILCAATIAVAWRAESATAAVPIAATIVVLVIAQWAVELASVRALVTTAPAAGNVSEVPRALYGTQLWTGALLALLFGASGFLAQARMRSALQAILWAAAAGIGPIGILAALYYRTALFGRSYAFAAAALALAALYAYATEALSRREARPGSASTAAIFATACVISLSLGMTFALEKGWLTVSLALMAAGVAYVASQRALQFLRWLAAAACILVAVRVAWDPRIVGDQLGTTPVFNWLIWGYGVPALAFWTAGWLLRKRADDVPSRMADSLAIVFTVLFFSLQIRHYINGGDIYRDAAPLAELGLHVCLGLAMTIGLERTRQVTNNIVHDVFARIIAAFTLAAIVFGLLLFQNPLFTDEPVGGRVFNLVLLAYGIPALLAGALAFVYRGTRPDAFRAIASITAVVLGLAYLSLQVRVAYQGDRLAYGPTLDAEQYTYSVVWLAFAVALLLIGIARQSREIRLASAAVMLITIAKVFLIDLSNLTGVWRAFSFIGLGAVLVGIGLLYQRLLFTKRRPPDPASSEAPPAQTES